MRNLLAPRWIAMAMAWTMAELPGAAAAITLEFSPVARGPHHTVWSTAKRDQQYLELATGLNFPTERGEYAPAQEGFALVPGGAVAWNAQHKLTLAASPNRMDAVQLRFPDGRLLTSCVYGLALYHPATEEAELIAEVRDCQGVLVASNQLLYPGALADGQREIADLLYTFTKSGMEQDVVLRDGIALHVAEELGWKEAGVRLEVWTTFTNPPQPVRHARPLTPGMAERAGKAPLADENLDFGTMRLGTGRTFVLGDEHRPLARVAKQWLPTGVGQFCLVEAVELDALVTALESLPKPKTGAWMRRPSRGRLQALRGTPPKPMTDPARSIRPPAAGEALLAMRSRPGVVIDYQTINSFYTNCVFSNETYHVSGPVYLAGEATVLAGAVFKYSPGAFIQVSPGANLDFQGSPYRPVICTAEDDDGYGQRIATSTGTPTPGGYADPAWRFLGNSTNHHMLANLKICYAKTGVQAWYDGVPGLLVRHAQFVHCANGAQAAYTSGTVKFQNVLFYHILSNVFDRLDHGRITAEHLTVDQADWLNYNPVLSTLLLTNCLLANVANLGAYSGSGNATDSGGDVFQTPAGLGRHYLPPGSGHRIPGLASIAPALAVDLSQMTVDAPLPLAGAIVNPTTLVPVITRDFNLLARGYHYWPLDYLASNVLAAASLTLVDSVAIGVCGDFGWDVRAPLQSEGKPLALNRIAACVNVQELTDNPSGTFLKLNTAANPVMRFRFTDFSASPGGPQGELLKLNNYSFTELSLRDCWLRGVIASLGASNTAPVLIGLTNNLIEGSWLWFYHYYYNQDTPITVHCLNNLFRYSVSTFYYLAGQENPIWTIQGNLFDRTPQFLLDTNFLDRSHNAFIADTPDTLGGSGNLTNLLADFQPGPLGNFYYPETGASNSLASLIDADTNRTAASVGLWHYCTTANQKKEGGSALDIGWHQVALREANPLLWADFESDSLTEWTVVDEGTNQAPSAWAVINGRLRQSSNLFGPDTSATTNRQGTFMYWHHPAALAWTNYTCSAVLHNTDDDGLGLMLRFQDPNNYYKVELDRERNFRKLLRKVGGAESTLASEPGGFEPNTNLLLIVSVQGDWITATLDGALLFGGPVSDSLLPAGTVALYSWGSQGLFFDDVTVTAGSDTSLAPADQDGDGLADLFEDANGNGLFDPGAWETDWQSRTTIANGNPTLQVFTPLE